MPFELFYNTYITLKLHFCFKKEIYLTYSFKINNFIISKTINHFQVNSENTIKHIDYVYCYYS